MHRKPTFVSFNQVFDRFRVMWRQTIPDENETSLLLVLSFHIFQYAKNGFCVDTTMLHPCQVTGLLCLWVPCNHAKKRKMLPSSSRYGNWSYSFFTPCSSDRRFVGHTWFIEKAKCGFVFYAPFLTAGQAVFNHVAMAFSSRSRALLFGFWQENPKRSSVCQTERSLYEISVSFLM